ncbi:ABC transporter permease [Ilumatobacter coccineus]|jgi:rhamnose transport system permease protein|uniref:Autoinducer 2 import system permease protein LsrC n=1 Tax=Ilumatobacter coccineus (strain NBRC 103263 / KCTC 29153 / YM16-304) TaxID=1313172 RepID=A0A6C7EK57_ILUCY|nr:ABC transporter permease [Ilumatobacter coccineus]BAN04336.1 putative ABC transporter permease protein [Ilumatobacter coccineus YM16-304]
MTTTDLSTAPPTGSFLDRFGTTSGALALKVRFLGVLVFLLLLVVTFTITAPRFLTLDNGRSILFSSAILMIAAAGQTLVVLTGNLDLSVGSIMGLTAYVVFDLSGETTALQPFVILIAVLIGAVLGFINGVLVSFLEIPSIVATLGTLSIYRGSVSFYADAKEVTSGQLPQYMRDLAMANWFGLSAYVWLAAGVVALVGLVLRKTPGGRSLYALGSNPKAAEYFGLSSNRIILGAYTGAGVVAAIAGLLLGARVGNINSLLGSGIELQVLAAVVIGGVSIWGGSGSVFGAAVGAIVLATINNGLVLLQVQEYYRLLIQGAAIVAAVGVDAIVRKKVLSATTRRRIMEVDA